MSDGYSSEIIDLVLEQTKIIQRMSDIDLELEQLPKLPKDLGGWIESLPDISYSNTQRFKVSDFKKISKLNKEYEKLKEKEFQTRTKLRVLLIDDVLGSIEGLNKERNE